MKVQYCPMAASREYPNTAAAAGFHSRTLPSRSNSMTASGVCSTCSDSLCCDNRSSSSACLRSVTSVATLRIASLPPHVVTLARTSTGRVVPSLRKCAASKDASPHSRSSCILAATSPSAAAVFGYSREAAIGQYWTFIVPAAIHGQLDGVWAAIVGQRGGNRSTNENITKDGQTISCEWFSTPLVGPGGRTIGVASLIQDVTEQVEAQEEVRRQAEQLRRTVEGAVLAMSHVVETRDPYTAGHERRVAELATAIAEDMGMDGEELTALRHGGLIHDIGKIAVPAEILAKPGRLSEVEFNLIQQHPATGFDILEVIDFGRPVAEIVLQHHERLDGSGYPRGLAGEAILPEARILAVADVAAACVRLVEEQGFQFTP